MGGRGRTPTTIEIFLGALTTRTKRSRTADSAKQKVSASHGSGPLFHFSPPPSPSADSTAFGGDSWLAEEPNLEFFRIWVCLGRLKEEEEGERGNWRSRRRSTEIFDFIHNCELDQVKKGSREVVRDWQIPSPPPHGVSGQKEASKRWVPPVKEKQTAEQERTTKGVGKGRESQQKKFFAREGEKEEERKEGKGRELKGRLGNSQRRRS